MTSRSSHHSNSNVVWTDVNDDHRPDDEPLSRSTSGKDAVLGEESSIVSHATYLQKDLTQNNGSTAKRSARKAPPTEPDRKSSNLQSSVASVSLSSIPLLNGFGENFNRVVSQEQDVRPELLPGAGDTASGSASLFAIDSLDGSQHVPQPVTSNHQRMHHNQQLQPPIARPKPLLSNPVSEFQMLMDTATTSSKKSDDNDDNPSKGLGRQQPIHPNANTYDVPISTEEFLERFALVSMNGGTRMSSLTPDQRAATVASALSIDDDASTAPSVKFRALNSENSRAGNPRSILNERYQKRYNRSFTKKDFFSIKDTRNGDHVPTFTSIFVCPESGETFLSGDRLSADLVMLRDGMHWYKNKAKAEFAAAGRAEDCFRFRSQECSNIGNGLFEQSFCSEDPVFRCKDNEQIQLSKFLQSQGCDSKTCEEVKKLIHKHEDQG